MKLIADSGSTKTDWAVLEESRDAQTGPVRRCRELLRFTSAGLNPNYMTEQEIMESLLKSIPSDMDMSLVSEIDFYGAGVNEVTGVKIRRALEEAFPAAVRISTESDMLGCARALLGRSPGFAAILGTGMNSCLYDGEKIVSAVPSLGVLLGDEGSAGYIGKMLLRNYLRGTVPSETAADLSVLTGGKGVGEIVASLYSASKPNAVCAELFRYVAVHLEDGGYCREIVVSAFRAFFRNVICLYPSYRSYSLNCAGSVAVICGPVLSEVAAEYGVEIGTLIQYPIDALVMYHAEF